MNVALDGHRASTATAASEPAGIPTGVVVMNTAIFALGFALWVIFGPSTRFIAKELAIPLSMATLIKTLPILTGSLMRIPVGILCDRLGARVLFPAMVWTASAAAYWISFASTATELVIGGLLLGLIGTTFAVGVQSVSSWSPKAKQGVALGIFGAGNVGTALTTFGLPLLLASVGWRGAFRIYAVVAAVGGLTYWLYIRNAPRKTPPLTLGGLVAPLRSARTWEFGFYYMATFGTFVAATLSLTDIYFDAYRVSIQTAGMMATTFTFTASLARIPGGMLADRFGAQTPVRLSLAVTGLCMLAICAGLPMPLTVGLAFLSALSMGIGMAATFKYIPQYFPASVGAVGGAVGALGGLGGFLLPQAGAAVKGATGSVAMQLAPLAAVALAAFLLQEFVIRRQAAAAPAGDISALRQAIGESVSPAAVESKPELEKDTVKPL
jgi:NNP family nitrate/nitrite transporter-like MFS transporter